MTAPGATILIVDDHSSNRKLFELMLQHEGYATRDAATGEEALASIEQSPPDLILLDVMMPDMDGYEVVARLKAVQATSSIPIIMVTALIDRAARLAGLNAGVEEFLTKPVDRAELGLRVRNLLRTRELGNALQAHSSLLEEKVQARTAELQQFRKAMDETEDAIFFVDTATLRFTEINASACNILGYTREALLRIGPAEVSTSTPEELTRLHRGLISGKRGGVMQEVTLVRKDGTSVLVEVRRHAHQSGASWLIVGVGRDITERKAAERKMLRLNGLYAVLSGINALIVRVRDREDLFRESCGIAVEKGAFALAWIGTLDPATEDVTPVAWAGDHAEEVTRGKSSARADSPRGVGGVGRAIRERRTIFNNDIAALGFGGPRLQVVLRLGFGSQITMPLYAGEAIVACLTIYAREQDYFDEEEIRRLTELSGNISFALGNIAQQQKLDKLSRIRAVSSEINAAIVRIRERNALLEEVCRIVCEHGKFELVWIGAIDGDLQEVHPIAWKGFADETAFAVHWSGIGPTNGTMAHAMRTGKASVRNNIDGDLLAGGTLRQEARRFGYDSSLCLPLTVDGKVTVLIILFATGRGFFDEDELALLNEAASDISFALQAIAKQARLDYIAYYDVLTGLANRNLFIERLTQRMLSAVGRRDKLAVYLLDLERFKNINDTLGQSAGDALLKQVAAWLINNGAHATQLARLGADQFAVVMPEVRHAEEVARRLERMLSLLLDTPFNLNEGTFRVAAKVGVALFPDDGGSAEDLLKNAEAALKKAKASGDPYLFYAQKMTESVAAKLTLENQLRQALDNEEFVLHYQPKVNIETGLLTSAEVLIRWNDPRTGLVPPAQFIPVLEETGMIHEVGRWAIQKAMADHVRWRANNLRAVRIAVNVSPRQLRSPGFIAEVEKMIGSDRGAAAGLELEITESLIMEDIEHSITSLNAIRAMGVTVAIDDFGTGFSSLAYLAKLPVDTLKIDRSFVMNMTTGPEGLSLVSTIIQLAHSLKLKVVAEGVETEEQSKLLLLLRCEEMQGFLVSRPVPCELFEKNYLLPTPVLQG